MNKIFSVVFIAIALSSCLTAAQDRPYPEIVSKCIEDYKSCALNNNSACPACVQSCAKQPELLSKPIKNVCTLLRDYCSFQEANPADTCTDPNCIADYQQCKAKGLSDSSCGLCANSCKSCPDKFSECKPNLPVPSLTPGECNVRACTYYAELCKGFSLGDECNFCAEACSGLCDEEARVCEDKIEESRCCYSDACNKKRICSTRGGVLLDSCGATYNVNSQCQLKSTDEGRCCYSDACNQKRICADRGGKLPDSCGRVYNVDNECKLSL